METENLFSRAKNWVDTASPNLVQVASAYRAMQKRIHTGKVEIIDDAEAALDLLAESYENLGGDVATLFVEPPAVVPTSAQLQTESVPQLDASPLVPLDTVPQKALTADERKNILADLKRTLRSTAGSFSHVSA